MIEIPPKATHYDAAGHEGRLFELGAGEYFQLEIYDAHYSAAWSSGPSLATLLERVAALLPPVAGTAVLLTTSAEGHTEYPMDEALAILRTDPETIRFARLDYPDRTFTWHEGSAVEASAEPGQFGFIGELFEPPYGAELMRATGSAEVVAATDSLVDEVSPLLLPQFGIPVPARG